MGSVRNNVLIPIGDGWSLALGNCDTNVTKLFKKFVPRPTFVVFPGEDAINVLINNLEELPRAVEFAQYWDKPEVWSILGHALLSDSQITESIDAFLKANDAKHYEDVIQAAGKCGMLFHWHAVQPRIELCPYKATTYLPTMGS